MQLAALGLKIVTYCGQTVTLEVVQQAINTVHIKLEMPLLSYHAEMIWWKRGVRIIAWFTSHGLSHKSMQVWVCLPSTRLGLPRGSLAVSYCCPSTSPPTSSDFIPIIVCSCLFSLLLERGVFNRFVCVCLILFQNTNSRLLFHVYLTRFN